MKSIISRGDVLVADEQRRRPRHGISGHGRVDARRSARPAQDLLAEAHHAHRARPRQAEFASAIDINTLEKSPADEPRHERNRRGGRENHAAAFLRSLSREPHDGQLHSHRPAHQRHGRRGNHRTKPSLPASAARTAASATHTGRSTQGRARAALWASLGGRVAEGPPARGRKWSSAGFSTKAGTCSWSGPWIFCRTSWSRSPRPIRLSGAITIFSPLDDGTNQEQAVRAIFGPDAFFALAEPRPERRGGRRRRSSNALHKWRDTHSDPTERRK